MSCGVGGRCDSDPALPWLWCRLEATAPIGLLAWEPPCAEGAALKRQKGKMKKKEKHGQLLPLVASLLYFVRHSLFFICLGCPQLSLQRSPLVVHVNHCGFKILPAPAPGFVHLSVHCSHHCCREIHILCTNLQDLYVKYFSFLKFQILGVFF